MAYASYDDYVTRFLGRAIRDEADFDRLALQASAFLDRMTMGKARQYRDTEGRLSLACCAVAEKLFLLEVGYLFLKLGCPCLVHLLTHKIGNTATDCCDAC